MRSPKRTTPAADKDVCEALVPQNTAWPSFRLPQADGDGGVGAFDFEGGGVEGWGVEADGGVVGDAEGFGGDAEEVLVELTVRIAVVVEGDGICAGVKDRHA